jgi:hypothetical protein
MHLPTKQKVLNSIFVPVLVFRNMLVSVFIVVLSYNPNLQIATCAAVLFIYMLYSLIFCPYSPALRVCLHLSDIVFICQLIILFLVSSAQYGDYSLNILQTNSYVY